jgi:hypothetical protein
LPCGNISLAPDLHLKVQVASFAFWQMNNPLRVLFASFAFGETSPHQNKVIIGVFSCVGFAIGESNFIRTRSETKLRLNR